MRRLGFALIVAALSAAAFAADLKIKVVDPQGAAVAGAQVELYARDSKEILAVQTTSAEGYTTFHLATGERCQVRALALGFAAERSDVGNGPELTIGLRLATASETVVVSATRTPVPGEEAGADVATLSGEELQTMNPVASDDAVRFLPGAVVDAPGRRGSLASLFVRGGNSDYGKMIVDGVSITEPGGTAIYFGTLPLYEADRLEFLRGTQSTLYGSDAMTSVMQVWTRTGSTPVPELRLGADTGNYGTENGYASLSGSHGRFDYNVFGNQFNTAGSGPNDDYSNSLEGANLGFAVNPGVSLRLRVREDHSVAGQPGAWNFNGSNVFNVFGTTFVLAPDQGGRARQNNLVASFDLAVKTGSRWTHHFTGFEYHVKNPDVDSGISTQNTPFGPVNTAFASTIDMNRAGFDYQGDYVERDWARTTVGYEFEDENGSVNSPVPPEFASFGHGLRLNQAVYAQQALTLGRLNVVGGGRFAHNTTFGNVGVPRIAAGFQVFRGGHIFSGTRLTGSYALGIKEPRFEETFVASPFQLENLGLKAERNRALEAGFQQNILRRFVFVANYYNNLFHDQIEFITINPQTFVGKFENVQKSLAHGAEVELQSRLTPRLSWNTSYTYTSTQFLVVPPGSSFPNGQGEPFIRRPKHSGTMLLSYLGSRWGGTLSGSFVGRRTDSDFEGFNIDHTPGHFLLDVGGWYKIHPRITAYANVENATDRFYEEVTGYPALRANFRAGMRFRIGGE